MTPQDPFERLTILERAQWLYDSASRRHVEALDRQQSDLDRHQAMLERHQAMLERHIQTMAQLADISARLDITLAAIKEMLNRPNGH